MELEAVCGPVVLICWIVLGSDKVYDPLWKTVRWLQCVELLWEQADRAVASQSNVSDSDFIYFKILKSETRMTASIL